MPHTRIILKYAFNEHIYRIQNMPIMSIITIEKDRSSNAVDALSIDVLMKFKHTKHSSKAKCVYVRHHFIILLH